MNTWIKLYRSILDDPQLLKGDILKVWVWILLTVDHRTGSMTTGRKKAAEILGMKASTLYSVLKRLKVQQRIDTVSTPTYTTISVLNWAKFQQENKVQQRFNRDSSQLQEEEYNNTREIGKTSNLSNPDYLINIPLDDISALREKTNATEAHVRSKGEDLYNWYLGNPKKNKKLNWRATLRNAIKKDFPLIEAHTDKFLDYSDAKSKGLAW